MRATGLTDTDAVRRAHPPDRTPCPAGKSSVTTRRTPLAAAVTAAMLGRVATETTGAMR